MAFLLSELIGDYILDDLKNEMPTRNEFRYRIENFGYTLFDVKTLKTSLMDKAGFLLLSSIDGKKRLKSILMEVSRVTNTPYFITTLKALKYLSYMSQAGLIAIKPVYYKFVDDYSTFPVLNGPNQISWLITNQCNLRCSHCGNTSTAKLNNELSKKECLSFIDQCAELKVFILNISGGEPFLRRGIFGILSYARQKGIEIGITTNGTLVNDKIARQIKKLDPFNVHISLDGIGKVHDDFRNKKGVFKKVVNSVRLFRKYKIPFGVTTSITKRNFKDLDNVKEFVKKKGINSWNLYYALPLGCLKQADAVSTDEFYSFAEKIVKFKEELKDITYISVGDSIGYYGNLKVREELWKGCGAGVNGCSVDAAGNVKGCPIQPEQFIEGSIREKSLREIWLGKDKFSYNRHPARLLKHCGKCKYSKMCKGGCKSSMFSQGSKNGYNDYCIYHIDKSNPKRKTQ